MFEIGNSLREARLRQQLDFNEIERRTKIRGKYLRALEEEQFDLLPSQTYVKGFLRNYADVLGLDGQLYVDEYNSRFVVGEDELGGLRPRRSAVRQQRNRRLESNVVLVALAAIALVTALVIGAWKSGGGGTTKPQFNRAGGAPAKSGTKSTAAPATGVLLVIRATRGNSLLEVHARGANGPLRYQGTLLEGSAPLKVWARKLWINVGNPEHLDVTLNGKRRSLGQGGQPRVLVIDRRGVHPASAA
jgi:helix-turn-helix protein